MTNILSKSIYANGLPSNGKKEGMAMVSKNFVLDLAENSEDIFLFRKAIMKSIDELSTVYQAAHYCGNIDELKNFLKF